MVRVQYTVSYKAYFNDIEIRLPSNEIDVEERTLKFNGYHFDAAESEARYKLERLFDAAFTEMPEIEITGAKAVAIRNI